MICQRCKEQTDCASIMKGQLTCEKCELRLQIQYLQSLNVWCAWELHDCTVERDKLRIEKAELEKTIDEREATAELLCIPGLRGKAWENYNRLKAAGVITESIGASIDQPDLPAQLRELEREKAELVKTLESILPPEYGDHGGPLCYIQAYYEDGTESGGGSSPFKTKTRINHTAINKARVALVRVKEGR